MGYKGTTSWETPFNTLKKPNFRGITFKNQSTSLLKKIYGKEKDPDALLSTDTRERRDFQSMRFRIDPFWGALLSLIASKYIHCVQIIKKGMYWWTTWEKLSSLSSFSNNQKDRIWNLRQFWTVVYWAEQNIRQAVIWLCCYLSRFCS